MDEHALTQKSPTSITLEKSASTAERRPERRRARLRHEVAAVEAEIRRMRHASWPLRPAQWDHDHDA
ncbi:MAG TPA: hypothetical protein VIK04_18950 [Solirubrobacteraceae bacterium]